MNICNEGGIGTMKLFKLTERNLLAISLCFIFSIFVLTAISSQSKTIKKLESKIQELKTEIREKNNTIAQLQRYIAEHADASGIIPSIASRRDTLAYKNKNPLNIKSAYGGNKWQGQIGVDKHGHVKFLTWEHGIRAGAIVLQTYAVKYKIDTVDGIVERFCTGEKTAYRKFLSQELGIQENERFDLLKRLDDVLKAMIKFESGQEFPDEAFVPYNMAHIRKYLTTTAMK